ncbi:MAG: hypothetical protein MZV65_13135 [Chromatiales bacterium]|nr:hypothetical protein [Chromatiales bacterium]
MLSQLPSSRPGKVACQDCSLFQLCSAGGHRPDAIWPRSTVLSSAAGRSSAATSLFAAGDQFRSIYAVRSGSLKTSVPDRGRQRAGHRILPARGDRRARRHRPPASTPARARALETTSVCEIPYDELEAIGDAHPEPAAPVAAHHEPARCTTTSCCCCCSASAAADERLAALLLSLSQRFGLRGYSLQRVQPQHVAQRYRQLPGARRRNRQPAVQPPAG